MQSPRPSASTPVLPRLSPLLRQHLKPRTDGQDSGPTGLFHTYTQLPPTRLSPAHWQHLQRLGLAGALALIVLALVAPRVGLTIFWGLYVPVLPLLFLVAPGIWRNVCPMATLNQIPRRGGFTRGWTLPPRVQQITPLVSAGLFLLIVPARKVLLDHSGPALAVFLTTVLCLAFLGGLFFKGKSGWCTQFCPMLGVERFYGQSPLVVIPNAHCRPCVGCTNHCHDFNPTAAYLQDLHDPNRRLGANRTLFAGALPGLILAFFTQPALIHLTASGVLGVYGRTLLFVAAGIGLFKAVEALSPLTPQQVVLCSVVLALNLFYWFVAPGTLARLGLQSTPATDLARASIALLTLFWVRRAWPREQAFLRSEHVPAPALALAPPTGAPSQAAAEVRFAPGPTVQVTGEPVLLDVALALAVQQGVIVDDRLRTADPRVYAVGDVAEYAGQIAGLWQASIELAKLAAVNLLGGDARYQPTPVPLALKVSGIDLLAVGTLTPPEAEGPVVCFEHRAARSYWKLVVQSGSARGAVVIGNPDLAGMLTHMVANQVDLEQALAGLEQGDWSVISALWRDQERGVENSGCTGAVR